MNHPKLPFLLFLFSLLTSLTAVASKVSVLSRQDYYTTEKSGEILIYLDQPDDPPATAGIFSGGQALVTDHALTAGMNRIPLSLAGMEEGDNPVRCLLKRKDGSVYLDTVIPVKKLPSRFNAVKIDRLSGTLIVGDLPFIPFGFYAYSPVQPTLPEEEVVRGFNMISPYQKIEDKTFKHRKAWMDRCAALGMKVNYNLLSVAGEGGVRSSMDVSDQEKRTRLIREVTAFRDHPALLSWYIADEPVGNGVPPESLIETYRLIKQLDPYHPVTMVFMTPQQAWRYRDAMDIVMADPYPVPNRPVTEVEYVSRMLEKTMYPDKPLWIVPQAFGGAEHWQREPTPQEMRVMTYLALINGARGIKYFVRNGLNGFPKSLPAWEECGRIALETAELTPFYVYGKEVSELSVDQPSVRVKGWRRDSSMVIICVNTVNKPFPLTVSLPSDFPGMKAAKVMFENRETPVRKHRISDMIDAFGTRVFRISWGVQDRSGVKDTLNMMVDPGFEYLPVPGVPSACYARAGKDRGATYFVDARVAHSGEHSVRLVTPEDGKGVTLSFFPSYMEYGHTYRLSVWAKGAPRQDTWSSRSFLYRLFHKKPPDPSFSLTAGSIVRKTFPLTTEWKKYEMFITPDDSTQAVVRISPGLTLDTRGTAWFDDLDLVPVILMRTEVAAVGEALQVTLRSPVKDGVIRYDHTGRVPDLSSPLYEGPALLTQDASLTAGVFREGTLLGILRQDLTVHKALGCVPQLENLFSARYDGGGFDGLTDGVLAKPAYKDPAWQGYLEDDLVATIDLGKMTDIHSIAAGFLQQLNVYIHYPRQASFYVSEDGKHFGLVYYGRPEDPSRAEGPEKLVIRWEEKPVRARYVRVIANNVGTCPDWAPGAGSKAWLFCDEIIVK